MNVLEKYLIELQILNLEVVIEVYSFSDLQQKHLNRKKIFQILPHPQQKIMFRVEKNRSLEKQMVWALGQVPTHWAQGLME